ncbi:unnamed protein product [Medioppia subpectinata]|uniref:GT23 domain-containing protein n=1 Tax=Medioppia subpectinata TaxID=1979941 RepID=A0A7R9KDL0_9ACAR|nr:unnamed protein product [Medioppia subpectinata]CAG2101298.1 unnamed protein product [Medioppia subpectinata]
MSLSQGRSSRLGGPVSPDNGIGTYDTSTLVLVQLIQRHGDHTPSKFYQGDPYANDSWPDGLGALTPKGKHRMYETGRQLRHRYGQWLGVSPKTVYQRSYGESRCLESAYAVSAGMYRPEGRWVWDRPLELAHLWQPMAVQTVPTDIDALLNAAATCPVALDIETQQANSAAANAYITEHQTFVDQLNRLTGGNFTTVASLGTLYTTLFAEFDYDPPKPPPPWLRTMGVKRTMAQLRAFILKQFHFSTNTVLDRRLRAGPLYGVFIDNMQTAVAMATNSTMVKVYHYVANDLNVSYMYRTINGVAIAPSEGSALVFELHLINGQYIVKVFYADNINETYEFVWSRVNMPMCKATNEQVGQCGLDVFAESLQNYIPVTFITIIQCSCALSGHQPINNNPYDTSTLVLVQILQKNGDQAPSSFYPNDPYANDTWPDGLGALTPKGKRRMYTTGQHWWYRYGQWYGISPKTIYQRSAADVFCLESAYAVSAGMYRPEGRWVWDRPLELAHLWQPMAVQTVPSAIDALLSVKATCPVAQDIESPQVNSSAAFAYLANYQAFLTKLNRYTGGNYTNNLSALASLYDTLYCELNYDPPKAPPAWLRAMGVNQTMAQLRAFRLKDFYFYTETVLNQRLRGGPFVGVLISNMQNAIALATNSTRSSYGSALVFELHLIQGQYIVKVYYLNELDDFNLEWSYVHLSKCKTRNDPLGQLDSDINADTDSDGHVILGQLSRAISELSVIKLQNLELRALLQKYVSIDLNADNEITHSSESSKLSEKWPQFPSQKYELTRRWIGTNVNQLWHYLRSTTNLSSATMSVVNKISEHLLYDLDKELCPKTNKLVCQLNKFCGFGCQMHHMVYCMIVAMATNRTLIMNAEYWSYAQTAGGNASDASQGSRVWASVFRPLSDTCLDESGASRGAWSSTPGAVDFYQVVDLPIIDDIVGKRPDYLPQSIPQELSAALTQLHGSPFVWFVSQIVRYLMRPSPAMVAFITRQKHRFKYRRPIVGVHVRRTDKIGSEAEFRPLSEYMAVVADYYDRLDRVNKLGVKADRLVYLATDDYTVWTNETKVFERKGYVFIGDPQIARTAGIGRRYSSDSLRHIILDVWLLSESDFLVCTFSSQVCRLAYELMQTGTDHKVPDKSNAYHSFDAMYYFGGQRAHNRIAVLSHRQSHRQELELRVGDIIESPSSFYAGDPYANDTWPDGLGALTPKGKRRMYETGRQLRHRYGQWLGVSPKTIYQRSAQLNRTLESSYAVAAGMYRPEGRWVWDRPLDLAHLWQPMAVQTVPTAIDALLGNKATCPVAQDIQSQNANSAAAATYVTQHQALVTEINQLTGNNFSTISSLAALHDTLYCELNYDPPKPPPQWLRSMGVKRTMAALNQFRVVELALATDTVLVQRLRAGPLVGVLIGNMQNAIAMSTNSTRVQVYHYVSDDIMVTFVNRMLNGEVLYPIVGSALVFELHQIKGQYIVKVLYAGTSTDSYNIEWSKIKLPKCQLANKPIGQCDLNTYLSP